MLAGRHCRPAKGLIATTDCADRVVADRRGADRVSAVADGTALDGLLAVNTNIGTTCLRRHKPAVHLNVRVKGRRNTRIERRHRQGVGGRVAEGNSRHRITRHADRGVDRAISQSFGTVVQCDSIADGIGRRCDIA